MLPGSETAPTALRAPMPLSRAEHLGHQFAEAVDNGRLGVKIGGAVDQSERFHQTANAVQAAQMIAKCGQHRQPNLPRGLFAGIQIQIGADAAQDQRFVGPQRPMTRQVNQLADRHHGLINTLRLGRRRQFEFQLHQSCFIIHKSRFLKNHKSISSEIKSQQGRL